MRLAVFLCWVVSSVAWVTADGLDSFQVQGVAEHSVKAPIVAKIPTGAKGIKNLGEVWPKYEADEPPSRENLADRKDLSA